MANIRYIANVLNQKGCPAIFEDTAANRPAAGFTGRIFISTDTFVIQRDNGTSFDTLSAGITGTAATGQVTFWGSATTLSGDNTFFWDNTNKRLGLGTVTPGVRLDIHGTGVIQQLNGTTTNNAFLDFQNAGVTRYRIGNVYNAGSNDFAIQLPQIPLTNAFYMLGSNGFVGLGTSIPGSKLHISNTTSFTGLTIGETGATAKQFYIAIDYTGNGFTTFQSVQQLTAFTPIVLQKDGGNIAIGNQTAPNAQFVTTGNALIGTNVANSNYNLITSQIYAGGWSFVNITIGTSQALSAPYYGGYVCTNTLTITLPPVSGLNFQFWVIANSGATVTVQRSGTDTILDKTGVSVTSLTVAAGSRSLFYQGGGSITYQLI